MKFIETPFQGCWIIRPKAFEDERGSFMETYKKDEFERHIGKVQFIQENESVSEYGVIRGMHFQIGEAAQAKLIRCVQGEILDVVIDLRVNSPTYKQQLSFMLSGANKEQLFVPKGFAHGFAVLSTNACVQYKVDAPYRPEKEAGISPLDPCFSIQWPIKKVDQKIHQRDLNWSLTDKKWL